MVVTSEQTCGSSSTTRTRLIGSGGDSLRAEGARELVEQLVTRERLREEPGHVHVQQAVPRPRRVPAADDHDRRRGQVGHHPQPLDDDGAVAGGEAEVQEHEIRALAACRADRADCVHCKGHLVVLPEELAEDATDAGIVVDGEDFQSGIHAHGNRLLSIGPYRAAGMTARTVVPAPGTAKTATRPPTLSTRLRMSSNPTCSPAATTSGSNPEPESRTSSTISPAVLD